MGSSHQATAVLLVEDEILIAEMITEAMAEHGFEVHAEADAPAALRYLQSGARVDVLFTDINLPGGMDGATLATHARMLRPDLPVVFASGRWGLLDDLQALPHATVLPKPYSPLRACTVIESLVGSQH